MYSKMWDEIDGLVQEEHNSSALAMELRLSCTNPWKWLIHSQTSMTALLKLEWTSNFTQYFIMDVITYPFWEWSFSLSIIGTADA